MKLLIGIGNPGVDYQNTRHNAGFLVLDELFKKKLPAGMIVKKSDVFMNNSGQFVEKFTKLYALSSSNLYVVHDDLDIPLGSYKIQFGKGPKDHNGLKSIDESLGTDQYWHVRIGIENRDRDRDGDRDRGRGRDGDRDRDMRTRGEEYVLGNFGDEEMVVLGRVINKVCQEIKRLLQ
jgi:PTH1 family peptidyl-tRNA hydrolase